MVKAKNRIYLALLKSASNPFNAALAVIIKKEPTTVISLTVIGSTS